MSPLCLGRHLCLALWAFSSLGTLTSATPTLADAPSTPYSLSAGSENEIGCFGQCLCPVLIRGPMTGTFALTPIGSIGDFHEYDVTNVDWVVRTWNGDLSITGQGEYRVGGAGDTQQQMILDVLVGGEAQHFDSGLVSGGSDFPHLDVSVAARGFFCWDSVLVVRADPRSVTAVFPDAAAIHPVALPNPFRDGTLISFDVPAEGPVDLRIHDVAGRLVRTLSSGRRYGAGPLAFAWDGRGNDGTEAPAGVYFARLVTPRAQATLRVARVR